MGAVSPPLLTIYTAGAAKGRSLKTSPQGGGLPRLKGGERRNRAAKLYRAKGLAAPKRGARAKRSKRESFAGGGPPRASAGGLETAVPRSDAGGTVLDTRSPARLLAAAACGMGEGKTAKKTLARTAKGLYLMVINKELAL